MAEEIARRLLAAVPVLAVVGIVMFMLGFLMPGDAADVMAGEHATPEQVQQLRERLGLDRSLLHQLSGWAGRVVRGDLGYSFFMQQPVGESIRERLEPTGLLALLALFWAVAIGLPTGVLAAVFRNTWIDRMAMVFALIGVCIPSFWLAILLIMVFAVTLGLLPAAGYVSFSEDPLRALRYLAMPALALGLQHTALLTRIVRSSMLDVLIEDYIRTARAKGVMPRLVLARHALPNALVPIITVIGNSAGILLSGVVIIEVVFNIPGIGRMIVQAIARRDFAVIQGSVLFMALVYVMVNLLVDLTYVVVDPRLRTR